MTARDLPVAASGRSAVDVGRALAEEAGGRARTAFSQPKRVMAKGRGSVVTETDLAIERFLHGELAREFPEHGVLSEETAASTPTAGWVWVIDPVDGTRNFASGIPFFCINIALCLDGEPVVGVTRDPLHDEMFWAERGCGAWRDGERLQTSSKTTVASSVLGVDIGYDDARGQGTLEVLRRLFPGVQSVRILGSAALGLAYAACGRYDIFIHHNLYPWDLAAGMLLVREAGGTITDGTGRPIAVASRSVVAGAPAVHADFLAWQRRHAADVARQLEE
jgi:fructose-1,6-bisphosphatase/inositol monophosphatase family enzyme